MAARSTGRAKQRTGAAAKPDSGDASLPQRKKTAAGTLPSKRTQAPSKTRSQPKTTATTKAESPRTKGAKPSSKARAAASAGTEAALLLEQSDALREELAAAQARIRELEELNTNVVNRIDWVIDSLQGILTVKR